MSKKEIALTVVGDNIRAQLKDKPTAWASGKNDMEAIGKLVYAHREEFGINIAFDRNDKPTRKYLENNSRAK